MLKWIKSIFSKIKPDNSDGLDDGFVFESIMGLWIGGYLKWRFVQRGSSCVYMSLHNDQEIFVAKNDSIYFITVYDKRFGTKTSIDDKRATKFYNMVDKEYKEKQKDDIGIKKCYLNAKKSTSTT